MDQTNRETRMSIVRRLWRENEWVYTIVGFMGGLLVFPLVNLVTTQTGSFLEDLVPEALGISFTILILDRLDAAREHRLIKDQLLRRMHSRYNNTALAAVEELRVLGHLADESLVGRNLRGSHLQDANLYQANLREVDLTNANLLDADLVEAILTDAKVSDEQLASCHIMWKAIMRDGNRYDGRYNLKGDIALARKRGFNPNDPQSMAEYYGVPLETFLEGQQWAQENLARSAVS